MTKKTWKMLMWVGIVVAVAGVVAAAVGFSMGETYPEEVPGWSITVTWIGLGVIVAASIGLGTVKKR